VPQRGRESWVGLMWEVESLRRRSAVFGRSHESDITLSAGGSVATKSSVSVSVTTRATGTATPTYATGRECRPRRSRATASACSSTSTGAA
jgi:hypothetical protein